MKIPFYKYQGTGNDFVIVDNRSLFFPKHDKALIEKICDRKFGVGADGLILLENHVKLDFEMVYFNADGATSSMCGNGARCVVKFAEFLGIIKNETAFEAVDGIHQAQIVEDEVFLKMTNVDRVIKKSDYTFLNTGSPHHVAVVPDTALVDVKTQGAKLRYGLYGEAGSNINFISPVSKNTFKIRTYERGVENETLSCGTGAVAAALAMHALGEVDENQVALETMGGLLKVNFIAHQEAYTEIYLIGPTEQVYKGQWI